MTIDPAPGTPPTPQSLPFRWGSLIGGMLLALTVGGLGNLFFGLAGASFGVPILAALVGAIPGLTFAIISLYANRNGFAQGLLIGGCVIGLIGGACGASLHF